MGCPDAELSILLTDDPTIHALNREWRGKDRATDVLSFSQVEVPLGAAVTRGTTPRGKAVDPALLGRRPVLGDIVISLDTAERQAPRYGHSLEAEVERLLVHGVLHLLGHDHVHGGLQAARMKREEARLLTAVRGVRRRRRRLRRRRPWTSGSAVSAPVPRVDTDGASRHRAPLGERNHGRPQEYPR